MILDYLFILIQGLLIYYYTFKFTRNNINYFYVSLFTFIYVIMALFLNSYFIINYPLIIYVVISTFLINYLSNKIDNSKSLFISLIISLVLSLSQEISIIRLAFILQRSSPVIFERNIIYYLFLTLSVIIQYLVYQYLYTKKFFDNIFVNRKYLILSSSTLFINLILSLFIGNAIYMHNNLSSYIVFILLFSHLSIILLIYIMILINKDIITLKRLEIQSIQYDNYKNNYHRLKILDERNKDFLHDLNYFLSLVKRKHREEEKELESSINQMISKLDNKIIYDEDDILLNQLILEISDYAKTLNKDILLNIQTHKSYLSFNNYEILYNLAKVIIENCNKNVNFNVYPLNQYIIYEFTTKLISAINIDDSNITYTQLEDYDCIKYILRTTDNENNDN